VNPRLRRWLQVPLTRLLARRDDILTIRTGDPLAARFAAFGDRSRIHGPHLDIGNPASVAIGDDVTIRAGVAIEALAPPGTVVVRFGSRIHVGYGTRFVAVNGIELADDVAIGHGCTLADTIHDWKSAAAGQPAWKADLKLGRPLRVASGAWVGNNCVITGGVTIGEGAIVAANCVINRDVPPYTIVAGNPAQVQRRRNGDGQWEWLVDPESLELRAP
jgi:acetyltransferase-like isoleucine patch superfamily enzyme